MKHVLGCLAIAASAALLPAVATAAEPASCKTIRMSDPGWTDITSTNAMFGIVADALGYKQKVDSLAVPITFQALKNGQLDAFLGNWMPAQAHFVEPLEKTGDLVSVHTNLQGIRFTLAVPAYVADAGVKNFADLAKNADKFEKTFYGIEPGAPANQHIQEMITAKEFGLGDWKLVESSEQGMLSQVERAERAKKWIVFLAWEPHPMNTKYKLTYLAGGDKYFGPNFGAAMVNTVERKNYEKECPNVGKLLSQVTFNVDMENTIMSQILDDNADPKKAAMKQLKANPKLVDSWLEGVTTMDGGDAKAAVHKALGL
ncbi:glycine betaine/proline transport system substrate-binding protein [Faunimonas pinastri]|uniref:Glycine betaine/proline transport system substrate-binding protein n=1 Tax=Faunimonas pinastri TaxID=1855383 RepID=A0A1H9HY04_9HYPH|nr:choline ABC transporter substrate-binding protein [Faunimonas pinastri]SEQ67092.1 glycine betaine/proline transport system substrate-binding protein [Faunimonas pinastri]